MGKGGQMDTYKLHHQKEKQKTDFIPMRQIILYSLLVYSLFSCSEKIIRVPEIHTEERTKIQTDSIYLHDSVFVMQKGDTIYISKTRYRDRIKASTDTIKQTDSVPYSVEVVKEVHRANKYERFTSLAFPLLLLCVLSFIYLKIRRIIQF